MDEHRIGLKPIARPVWPPTGQALTRPVEPRCEWLYVYAFVCPESGACHLWLVPEVTSHAHQLVMQAFATSVLAGPAHHVLLVQDGAGFPVPAAQGQPPGIEIIILPPYSPELQPAERLWTLTDLPLVNRCFDSLDALSAVLEPQCAWLETQRDRITRLALFHW